MDILKIGCLNVRGLRLKQARILHDLRSYRMGIIVDRVQVEKSERFLSPPKWLRKGFFSRCQPEEGEVIAVLFIKNMGVDCKTILSIRRDGWSLWM